MVGLLGEVARRLLGGDTRNEARPGGSRRGVLIDRFFTCSQGQS